jgi:hypothetical protein
LYPCVCAHTAPLLVFAPSGLLAASRRACLPSRYLIAPHMFTHSLHASRPTRDAPLCSLHQWCALNYIPVFACTRRHCLFSHLRGCASRRPPHLPSRHLIAPHSLHTHYTPPDPPGMPRYVVYTSGVNPIVSLRTRAHGATACFRAVGAACLSALSPPPPVAAPNFAANFTHSLHASRPTRAAPLCSLHQSCALDCIRVHTAPPAYIHTNRSVDMTTRVGSTGGH